MKEWIALNAWTESIELTELTELIKLIDLIEMTEDDELDQAANESLHASLIDCLLRTC